jgi:GntR family transcriptional regulator, arabinose operon transcriptional repressor
MATPRTSKQRKVKEHLLTEMFEQRIPVGGQLPTEQELTRQFSVSRTTVRQALSELSSEGFVQRQQGRGTFRISQNLQPRRSGRSMLVGVWFNRPRGPLFGPISDGIHEELGHWEYHAVFELGGTEVGDENRGIDNLVHKGLDGFLIAPSENPEDTHEPLIELIRRKLPLVFVDRLLPGCEADVVCTHGRLGAEEIVTHLIELGHRRIGFIGPPGLSTIEDRLRGYRDTMQRHGLPVDPAWIEVADHVGRDTGRQATRSILSLPAEHRPTALFGANDWVAVTIAVVARDRGLRVPEDLSVAGFDDAHVHIGSGDREWLTTYAQPLYQIGRQAAELLVRRIEDPGRRAVQVLLKGELVKRASTAPPAEETGKTGKAVQKQAVGVGTMMPARGADAQVVSTAGKEHPLLEHY